MISMSIGKKTSWAGFDCKMTRFTKLRNTQFIWSNYVRNWWSDHIQPIRAFIP
ncbi:unnamed protein product [Schistosoma curassoni]|uniref:Uncharacterized protein n=1 Tax=Schistosoma curassoni TaxID=6186 RepID=A0A183L1K2_9TREM|nr:unnamed protein product [Schistosoma curassoni]